MKHPKQLSVAAFSILAAGASVVDAQQGGNSLWELGGDNAAGTSNPLSMLRDDKKSSKGAGVKGFSRYFQPKRAPTVPGSDMSDPFARLRAGKSGSDGGDQQPPGSNQYFHPSETMGPKAAKGGKGSSESGSHIPYNVDPVNDTTFAGIFSKVKAPKTSATDSAPDDDNVVNTMNFLKGKGKEKGEGSRPGKGGLSIDDLFKSKKGKRKSKGVVSPSHSIAPISNAPSSVAPSTVAPSTEVPVLTMSPSPQPRRCEPTTGPCFSTAVDLQRVLGNATVNDVVAVCANGNPIATSTAIVIEQSGITLCCENGEHSCRLTSNGTDNIIDAMGASMRLQDLTFENGVSDLFFGGNVAIDGTGDHFVVGCNFRNGSATRLGGNLFVQTNGTLTVEDSSFVDGTAGESGGGIYVLNARNVSLHNSTFVRNTATDGTGGGLFTVLENATDYGQNILLEDSTFVANKATIGGGFFVTQLGILPRLAILNSVFDSNVGSDAAGAGAIAESLDNLNLTISGTVGVNNTSPVCRDILGFFDASVQPLCISASDPYPQ
jgi:hypothetical protein